MLTVSGFSPYYFGLLPTGKEIGIFIVSDCLENIKRDNNRYHYGGTWKSKKIR